jgi:hypothetical protein
MKPFRTFLLVVLAAAAPAFAQDNPAGPGSGDPAAPVGPGAGDGAAPPKATDAPKPAEAKKERVADPKAIAALERYAGLLWSLQRGGAKAFGCRAELPMPQLGGEGISITSAWSQKSGLDVEFDLPAVLLESAPPEVVEMIKKQLKSQLKPLVQPYLNDPLAEVEKYSLAFKETDGKAVVTMTAFAKDTPNERQQLHFDKDGLMTRIVLAPRLDPDDPTAAMLAGVDLEIATKHEKRGDKYVRTWSMLTLPMGEVETSVNYYERPDAAPLLKSIEIKSQMLPEPQVVSFFDWTIDGKAVEGTAKAKPAEKKPESAGTEKPNDPAAPGAPAAPAAPTEPAKDPAPAPAPPK